MAGPGTATGVAIGLAQINGKVEQVSAVDPRAAGQIFNVSPVQGSLAGLGRTGIAVYKDVATSQHLRLGSTVPALFKDTGPQKLTVALIYGDATARSTQTPCRLTSDPPVAVTQRSLARYHHWPLRCCSSPVIRRQAVGQDRQPFRAGRVPGLPPRGRQLNSGGRLSATV